MKVRFTVLFFLIAIKCSWGNMSSPIEKGTLGCSPFTNKYVEIEKEIIKIKIDDDFEEAKFEIEYVINVEREGIKIPLLFLASDFKNGIEIYFNDTTKVELKKLPWNYYELADSNKLDDFEYHANENLEVKIQWSEDSKIIEQLRNLKYFELNIPRGKHKISVKYIASVWIDKSSWVKRYFFRYALSPARYWKNFKELEIELDANEFQKSIVVNLGKPNVGDENSYAKWNFEEIPANLIQIKYEPKQNYVASMLIFIQPIGIAMLLGLFLVRLHIIKIKKDRIKSDKKVSKIVVIGSFIVPLIILLGFIFSFEIIDVIIGNEASRFHGYYFMIIFIYPFIIIVYMILIWLVDFYWRQKNKVYI